MYLVLLIVAILVCILLGVIVLIQNPKGGGLSSNFSSSSQLLGVQKTGDILEKGTWILAIMLMVLSLAVNVAIKSGGTSAGGSEYRDQIQKASKPSGPVGTTAPLSLPAKPADTTKK
ncbi:MULTISPECIES: preprotein translocase subunit SecG [unclassified Mucilaginibacter]|uniref:preprotein translocase subunit SecG n=1 Tax=unclassified Mucilaginibacter TaxID=2617802 RepID=UPI0031F69E85